MTPLRDLAPEEIVAGVFLVIVLTLALLRPGPIQELFDSPYSTPAPEGGPARQIVPDPRVSPASGIPSERVIGAAPPLVRPSR